MIGNRSKMVELGKPQGRW